MRVERFSLLLKGKARPEDDMGSVMLLEGHGALLEGPFKGAVRYEARVIPDGEESFRESGTLEFAEGTLQFDMRRDGVLQASPDEALQLGHAVWRIAAGTGVFAGASGQILTNFTVSTDADVVENIAGVVFLPD